MEQQMIFSFMREMFLNDVFELFFFSAKLLSLAMFLWFESIIGFKRINFNVKWMDSSKWIRQISIETVFGSKIRTNSFSTNSYYRKTIG